MTILLLGANGQLGQTYLAHAEVSDLGRLVPATRDGRLLDGTACEQVDLSSSEETMTLLNRVRPSIILNAAAYNAVDQAEDEPEKAFRINRDVVSELGSWAAVNDALVVHFSTDYVFDGRKEQPYAPNDQTNPLSTYGRSKLAGEEALRESGARHLLLRTAWVYSNAGNNFMKTMLRLARERDEVKVVADQHGSPTTTRLIVESSLHALTRIQSSPSDRTLLGAYHLVASGSTSWHGFAKAIFDRAFELGLITKKPRLEAIMSAEFKSKAHRPSYSVLDNRFFCQAFGVKLPDWHQGLEETLSSARPS